MRNIKRTIVSISLGLFVSVFLVSFTKSENIESNPSEKTLSEKITSGKSIYTKTCLMCHQGNGQGIPNAFPPLAKSDYLNADVKRAIDIVLHGKTGEIIVNGVKYNSIMTPQALTNQEVVDVLTYVYNSWGNNKTNVTISDVQKLKENK